MVVTGSLFDLYPEFVEDDTRKDRNFGYQISKDFLNKRYNSLLPPHIIEGKTILDLGAAIGSAGAWCLHYDAKHYTGVDSHFSDIANKNLNKYFDPTKWQWIEMNVEDYLEMCPLKYDVVLMAGIIYYFDDHDTLLKKVKGDTIIIETDNVSCTSYKPRKLEWEDEAKPRKFEPKGYYDKFFSNYEYDDFLERTGQLLLPEFYNDNYRVIYCYEK
tara:strand:- start:117 stop:761 length:645 start_codon:yes stop_codon:yes gene_type:complete